MNCAKARILPEVVIVGISKKSWIAYATVFRSPSKKCHRGALCLIDLGVDLPRSLWRSQCALALAADCERTGATVARPFVATSRRSAGRSGEHQSHARS